jgi:hypothetical protein
VLSFLSFSNTQFSKEINPSSFSHRWRIWMPSWLSLYSSNLLLNLQGVQQPCEDLVVESSFKIHNSKNSLLPVPVWTLTQMPPWKSIFSQNFQWFYPLCTPCTCSMPTWQSPSKYLVILVFLKNSQQSFSQCTTLHMLNSHLAELHITPQIFCLQLYPSYTTLPPKVFSNLIGLSLSC